MHNNYYFDVLDKKHDGYVTWDEYKIVMEVGGYDEEAGRVTFNLLDKDKSGKIDRKEFTDADIKFWFTLDDAETRGMYGAKFE